MAQPAVATRGVRWNEGGTPLPAAWLYTAANPNHFHSGRRPPRVILEAGRELQIIDDKVLFRIGENFAKPSPGAWRSLLDGHARPVFHSVIHTECG